MIDRHTVWQEIGDVSHETWATTIRKAGGPAALQEWDAWDAARPHSAVLLNKLRAESSYGTMANRNDPKITKNPFSLRKYLRKNVIDSENEGNVNGYLWFDTWAEGVEATRLRISDPDAFAQQTHDTDNPYPKAKSIAQLIYAFSPPKYNNTERIVAESIDAINGYLAEGGEPVSGPLVFGRVPKPAMQIMIVTKPEHNGSAYGYDRVPPRKNVGLVHHETQGRGTGQFYHSFFSCPGGERCGNALVDFFIDRSGNIFCFNDPFGTRAGWANGGGVGDPGGLEGDGVAFYRVFGSVGVNQKLVSIEYEKTDQENMTDAQVQSGAALSAWIHDIDGQPFDSHPFVPKYGCVTSLAHFELGTTNCGKNELDDISRIQSETREIMQRWQTELIEDPQIPGGLTLEEAVIAFGTGTRYTTGKTKPLTGLGFDPEGQISLAWATRAAEEQVWPQIQDWHVSKDPRREVNHVYFANGWILSKPSARAGWGWTV